MILIYVWPTHQTRQWHWPNKCKDLQALGRGCYEHLVLFLTSISGICWILNIGMETGTTWQMATFWFNICSQCSWHQNYYSMPRAGWSSLYSRHLDSPRWECCGGASVFTDCCMPAMACVIMGVIDAARDGTFDEQGIEVMETVGFLHIQFANQKLLEFSEWLILLYQNNKGPLLKSVRAIIWWMWSAGHILWSHPDSVMIRDQTNRVISMSMSNVLDLSCHDALIVLHPTIDGAMIMHFLASSSYSLAFIYTKTWYIIRLFICILNMIYLFRILLLCQRILW